jgi:hypothetical protein
MSKDQIASLKDEYKSGVKPSELMGKYNITKHALYHHVGGSKRKNILEKQEDATVNLPFESDDEVIEPSPYLVNTEVEDPLIDFEQIASAPHKSRAINEDDIFNITTEKTFNGDFDLFHPDNILTGSVPPVKPEKWSISNLLKTKNIGKEEKKSHEQIKKEEEQERLKLVYQVRLYLYTFRDQEHLFSALSIENDNKKINKYIHDLYKRKVPELKKLLDFIKFHIRHNNNSVTGNFVSSIFFTILKVVEMILTRMGIDLTGLAEELKNDPDVVSNLKEIEIEMTANKLNVGAKTDILLKICTKGLAKFTENKMINNMKAVKSVDSTKVAMDKLNTKPLNSDLKQKYDDI